MEELLPELRSTIGPRLKGKAPERQRTWIQVWGWAKPGGPQRPQSLPGEPPFPAGLGACCLRCPLLPASSQEPVLSPQWIFRAPCVPLPSPACVPGAGRANRRKPSPGAKRVLAKFSEPFLEQRGLNPAQTLAKD